MNKYISFLRGVNMTGHNSIKMADLLYLYKSLGYNDAETYIQSGNVIFNSENTKGVFDIALEIEKEILARFNYKVPVMIRTLEEMKKLSYVNPFLKEENFNASKMAVILLQEKPSEDQVNKVNSVDYPPDKFEIIGREIYIYCPNGFGRTKLYTNFFEKKMSVVGTSRNWKTITTILRLSEKK